MTENPLLKRVAGSFLEKAPAAHLALGEIYLFFQGDSL
jgi:hypothetical protein